MVRRVLFSVLLFAISTFASDISFLRLRPEVVNGRLHQLTVPVAERGAALKKAFQEAGCAPDQIVEQKVPESALETVQCTIVGSEPGSIVFSAPLDYDSAGDELVVDDATLEMLPLLVQSFKISKPRHSLVFVGFAGRAKQAGANTYLSQLSKDQRKQTRGMIYLERIGRSPLRYMFPTQNHTPGVRIGYSKLPLHDPTPLNKWLDASAKSVGMEYPEELEDFYFTQTLSFEHKGIDALTLSSPAYTMLAHQARPDAKMLSTTVDFTAYYETYNLLCVYVMKLDGGLK